MTENCKENAKGKCFTNAENQYFNILLEKGVPSMQCWQIKV